jgi:Cys-tRNA(Pro) deacylase
MPLGTSQVPLAITARALTILLMAQKDYPKTHAVRCLLDHGIAFEICPYRYEERGGTRVSARELGVDEHLVVKTLVMETDAGEPLIVLMHGDCEVSTKQLARVLNVKSVSPCAPQVAQRHSGYLVGGTSPFGTRRRMPVYCEASILDLDQIYINGGARGLLVRLDPKDLSKALDVTSVHVAISNR